ncbi:MAG: hypothetical protein H7Z40_09560 [Phycisphaerae bacterium]|nr:hypothetical protein [Gemmatimonadaceae bacterium]
MNALFLTVLLLGLITGVRAMLLGTEHLPSGVMLPAPHERKTEHVLDAEPSALFNWASVAAFAFAFGLAGYLITRFTTLSIPVRVLIAALSGGAAMAMQSLLIARWAIPSARADQVDERYLLQGTIGRVTRPIPAEGQGELQYTLDNATYTLPARDTGGASLDVDVEVVLDRVEAGVAYVEPWAKVEQRL